jgi:hypothetical protein
VRVGLGERQWRLGKNDVEAGVVNLWLMGGMGVRGYRTLEQIGFVE